MFEHLRVQRWISAYHDGELSPSAMVRVENHLQHCTACRRQYRRLAFVANAVRHLPRQQAPESLALLIRRRVNEEIRGMVPILRDELLSSRSRPILAPAFSLGALITLIIVAGVLALGWYQEATLATPPVALVTTSVDPVFLEQEMVSPRVRGDSVSRLPYADIERGKSGSLLTLATIDQRGAVYGFHVIDQMGDEQMLARTLEVLRDAGFEPARVGDRNVATNFLYFFTTTVVRSTASHRIISSSMRLETAVS